MLLSAGRTVDPGWLGGDTALWLGVAALFAGIALGAGYLLRGGNTVRLAAADVRKLMATRERTKLSALTQRLAGLAERSLDRRGGGRVEAALEAAGSSMRAGEFALISVCAAVVAFVAGAWWSGGPVMGVACAIVGGWAPWAWLRRQGRLRQTAFTEQLVGTLQLMAGTLRAGFGLAQAIDVVAEEAPSPTADEFYRVKVETHLGRDLDDALAALAERVGGGDIDWVVEGVRIHREIGGNLAEILDTVADTLRDRAKLRGQVKALSAEGRFSAVFLVVLPFALAAFIGLTNPGYLAELTSTVAGRVALGAGAVLMAVGGVWMRRVIRVEI